MPKKMKAVKTAMGRHSTPRTRLGLLRSMRRRSSQPTVVRISRSSSGLMVRELVTKRTDAWFDSPNVKGYQGLITPSDITAKKAMTYGPATGLTTTSTDEMSSIVSGNEKNRGVDCMAIRPKTAETVMTPRYMTAQVRPSWRRWSSTDATKVTGEDMSDEPAHAEERGRHDHAQRQERQRSSGTIAPGLPHGADDDDQDEGEEHLHDGTSPTSWRVGAAAGGGSGSTNGSARCRQRGSG